jgi:hypothetical protein
VFVFWRQGEWFACLLWVPGRMIVHSLGTADRKLLGNGSFVSGHCNCGHVVGCVLLSNAILNAMQFAGRAVLLAVKFCVSKVVFWGWRCDFDWDDLWVGCWCFGGNGMGCFFCYGLYCSWTVILHTMFPAVRVNSSGR